MLKHHRCFCTNNLNWKYFARLAANALRTPCTSCFVGESVASCARAPRPSFANFSIYTLTLCALTLCALSTNSLAGGIGTAELPDALTSKQLQMWVKQIKPSDTQRLEIERAFDAYVDQWTQLRKNTLRPGQEKLQAPEADEVAAENAWRNFTIRTTNSIADLERNMFTAMRAAQGSEQQQIELDRIAAARARKRASFSFTKVPLNLPRISGLKSLPESTQAAIDTKQQAWEISATPSIERLAMVTLENKHADREREISRKVRAGERTAVREISALLPKEMAEKYLRAFRRRMLGTDETLDITSVFTPSVLLEKLNANADISDAAKKSALEKIDAWQTKRDALEESLIDAMLADGATPEAASAIAAQMQQMNTSSLADITNTAGMPEMNLNNSSISINIDGSSLEGMLDDSMDTSDVMSGLGDGNAQVSFSTHIISKSDAATATDIAAGAQAANAPTNSTTMIVMRGDDGSGSIIHSVNTRMTESDGNAVEPGNAVFTNSTAADAGVSKANINSAASSMANSITSTIMGGMELNIGDPNNTEAGMAALPFMTNARGVRPFTRQDIEEIRLQLGVNESQRAMWETLADDLLQSNADFMRDASANPMAEMMPAPDQTPDAFMQARIARRTEIARLENAWFDNVQASMQGISAEAVQGQRSRRAVQRSLAATRASSMLMPELMMNRWIRVDLDAAAQKLSPAAQQQCAVAVQAWRTQLITELEATQIYLDAASKAQLAMIQSMMPQAQVEKSGDTISVQTTLQAKIDPSQMTKLMALQKSVREAWKRINAVQESSQESVLATLEASEAKILRRALRMQTHPEAFRSQKKVESTIDNVMALKNLSPEQLQNICGVADTFRLHGDALVEQTIEQINHSDKAMSVVMQIDSPESMPSDKQFQNIASTDQARTDAMYDSNELNARAIRQLRAALSAEQAAAAKLN